MTFSLVNLFSVLISICLQVLNIIAATPNICNSLHMPAQHGSTTALERMQRGYSREVSTLLVCLSVCQSVRAAHSIVQRIIVLNNYYVVIELTCVSLIAFNSLICCLLFPFLLSSLLYSPSIILLSLLMDSFLLPSSILLS